MCGRARAFRLREYTQSAQGFKVDWTLTQSAPDCVDIVHLAEFNSVCLSVGFLNYNYSLTKKVSPIIAKKKQQQKKYVRGKQSILFCEYCTVDCKVIFNGGHI